MESGTLNFNECVEKVYEYVIANMTLDNMDETVNSEGAAMMVRVPIPLTVHPMLPIAFQQYESDEPNEGNRTEFFETFDHLYDGYHLRIEKAFNAMMARPDKSPKLTSCFFYDDDFEVNMVDFTSEDKNNYDIAETHDYRGLVVELTFNGC